MDTKVPKKLKLVEAPKVKEVDTAKTDLVVQRLDTLIQYMERIDWKLWMMTEPVELS